MFRIFAVVIFLAIAYFVYDELKRRKGVVNAETDYGDALLKERENTLLKKAYDKERDSAEILSEDKSNKEENVEHEKSE